MKKIEFKTGKGEFLVFHIINSIDEAYEDGDVFYKLIGKLSDITDVQASEIVDTPKLGLRYFTDYTQSLHSLIKSKGIYLYENPIGDYKNYSGKLDDYQELLKAEQKTFYNPYLFEKI